MEVFFGAGNIISPLGNSLQENWNNILNYRSEIKPYKPLLGDEKVCLSKFKEDKPLFEHIKSSIDGTLSQVSNLDLNETLLILSTTKGDVQQLENNDCEAALLDTLCEKIAKNYEFANHITVSNACVSGISALIMAHDFVKTNKYKNVLVVAADACTSFVVEGFKTFFALSSSVCQPYDLNRTGINLGEAVGSALVSSNEDYFLEKPIKILGGASANDANHISGPSRTGEGLYRAIQNTLKQGNCHVQEIDHINAHGTATCFNDDMESMAFDRLEMNKIPTNSLKGYFGHTLGAAGLIESLIALKELQENLIVGTAGFEELGTIKPIAISAKHIEKTLNRVLKTGSGFGGCNAAILFEK